MAESDRQRGSRLPDQTEEIKKREDGTEGAGQIQPEDYPQGLVDRDEIANEEERTSYKDIHVSKQQRGNPDNDNPMDR